MVVAKDVTRKTLINLAIPNSNSISLRILRQACHRLSNLHNLAVLIRTLLMVAIRTTFRCGMRPWLRNKEVNHLKVSSDKSEPLRHNRDTRRVLLQVDDLECLAMDTCDMIFGATSDEFRCA